MFETLPHNLRRMALRRMREDDLDAFHAYRSDPEVARFQGWSPMTRPEAAAYLQSQAAVVDIVPGSWRQIGIAALQSDLLIGDAGLYVSPDTLSAEFGLSITPAAQGNGYGSECVRGLLGLFFSATPVREIFAKTDLRNHSCLAVLARSGMRLVETRRAEYKGEVCTEHVFSVRKAER